MTDQDTTTKPPVSGVWKKVAKAQSECDNAAKSKKNSQAGFKYAGLDDIFDAAKQAITDNGLALVQNPIKVESIEIKGSTTMRITMSNRLVDIDTGDVFEIVSYGDCSTAGLGDKAIGGATTYARKYGLCLLLAIATEDDTDQHSDRREPFDPDKAKGSKYAKQKTLAEDAREANDADRAAAKEPEPTVVIPAALHESVVKLLKLRSKSSVALRGYTPEKFWQKSLIPLSQRQAKPLDAAFINGLIAASDTEAAPQ